MALLSEGPHELAPHLTEQQRGGGHRMSIPIDVLVSPGGGERKVPPNPVSLSDEVP